MHLTPVKVRGKRRASQDGLPLTKRRRRGRKTVQLSTQSTVDTSSKSSAASRHLSLSRLERLPTELLGPILLYSGNPDLPLVSRTLLSKLSDNYLQRTLAFNVLDTLRLNARDVTPLELRTLQQLFERRFVSWAIIDEWLRPHLKTRTKTHDCPLCQHDAQIGMVNDITEERSTQEDLLRWACEISNEDIICKVATPRRALTSPWTKDRLYLLLLWSLLFRFGCIDKQRDKESYREAQFRAIELQDVKAFSLFDSCLERYDDHILEHVVFKGNCNRAIMDIIGEGSRDPSGKINPLNPSLWQWADQPPQLHNGEGKYLKQFLLSMM